MGYQIIGAPATPRATPQHRGSGSAYPTTDLVVGDTFLHTALGCLMVHQPRSDGVLWTQAEVPVLATIPDLEALRVAAVSHFYEGFRVFVKDLRDHATWSSNAWRFTLYGSSAGMSDSFAQLVIPHSVGRSPLRWGVSKPGQATDAINLVMQPLAAGQDSTRLIARFIRTDTHAYFPSQPVSVTWWANF